MKNAFVYLIDFLALQLIGGYLVKNIWQLVAGSADTTTAMLVTMSATVSLLTIALFLLTRWTAVSPTWLRTRPWSVLAWSVVAALGLVIPSAWLQEQMPELPNLMTDEFEMLLQDRWGYAVIGLLAPLSEEIVFRGAILKSLLQSGRLPVWGAIALSALLFAVVHMNPVQMPHAFAIGLLLGWMYWRTGSILPGMAYHWANNSVAYVVSNVYPDPDITLADIFRGSQSHVYMAVAFSLLIVLPALYQLNLWMKRADEQA